MLNSPTAIYLGITTTERETGIALIKERDILYEKIEYRESHQNEVIFGFLKEAFESLKLNIDSLAGIGVVIGPGMFTSLRVGLACAKGLSLKNKIPIKGFDSLSALAFSVPPQIINEQRIIIPVIDIRRQELYYQIFQGINPISEKKVVKINEFLQLIPKDAFLIGSGIYNHYDIIKNNSPQQFQICQYHYPQPHAVAFNALKCITKNDISDTKSLVPFYIRNV